MRCLSCAVSLLALAVMMPPAFEGPALAAAPAVQQLPDSNPFAAVPELPFGAPAYDKIKDGDYQPAIDAAMRQHDAEIAAIADNPEPASFDNTIVALEKSGRQLDRIMAVFGNMITANTNDTLDKVNAYEAPRLAAHHDAILLNGKLFARVQKLHADIATSGLDEKQKFLLERYYTQFVRAGANLSNAEKKQLRAVNEKIAKLTTAFRNRLLAATNAAAVEVSDKAELDGLSDAEIARAAEAAKARKLAGKYLLVLTNTTQQPILASLKDRALRQKVMAASESRGDIAGRHDLRDLVATLAQLRAERAKIAGFPNIAAFTLDDQMAKTPEAARALLAGIVPAATRVARSEAHEIQEMIDQENGGFTLTAADWAYYAAKVQKAKYDVDDAEVRQYFELNRVLEDGVFYAANQLYGLTFKERKDLPVYDPDVRVFEVSDADGSPLALFYADYFARPNKSGGAWCDYLNQPSGLEGRKPVVVNVGNFPKPAPGQPALIDYDDVVTMFHEFGHAIHAMVSVQYYPSENGFRVPTDVVEFPSQFNEHWALYPSVLAHYAKHYRTGEAMPDALVEKLKRSRNYGTGYATTELVAAALLDLDWHTLPTDAPKQDPDRFEATSLHKNGVDLPEVPPRYRTTYFQHIWGGSYEGNYYSYLWGEILDDDAFEWFTENGGLTRANGQRFRDMMLAPGYTADPMVLYRAFRGRDPSVDALKRQRGLVED